MVVLEAHRVTKSFVEGRDTVPVLKGISLELERGEVVALEGPSGSGKTTLLFILGCMLTPTSGRVVIEGERGRPPPARAAAGSAEAVDRFRVPAVQPVSRADRPGERASTR